MSDLEEQQSTPSGHRSGGGGGGGRRGRRGGRRRRASSPPTPAARRQVRRRLLDTSTDIRSALDDYVSSDTDDTTGDGDFEVTREDLGSDSDFSSDDHDSDHAPSTPRRSSQRYALRSPPPPPRSPPPHPRSPSPDPDAPPPRSRASSPDPDSPPPRSRASSPDPDSPPPRPRSPSDDSSPASPPHQPLAASTPRHRADRPSPPPVHAPDPTKFVWTDADENDPFVPKNFVFDDVNSGVGQAVKDLPQNASILDYFVLFFDAALMDIIVTQTNNFYDFCGGEAYAAEFSPVRRWKNTDIGEMYVFLALSLMMPMSKKYAIRDYWQKDCMSYLPAFGKYISRDRYQLILRFLHFADNANIDRRDSMFKIRTVFDNLMKKFREFYKPHQNLVIDESLVLFRGRISFRQYIRTKRHRFGLKIFVLCDCKSGCVLDMILYTGKTTDVAANDRLGKSGAIVREMMGSYVGKGHVMYLDNWYTSPSLCQYLYENDTGTCGTVRENRKLMPQLPKKQKKGDIVRKKCENILAVKWKDKRSVTTLSTVHEGWMKDSGKKNRDDEPLMKPDIILDYNINMRLVDKSDMMIGGVECVRKTVKWYKKLFFHLIDVCVLNSYLYYKSHTKKDMPLRYFVHDLVYQMLEKYGRLARVSRGRAASVPEQPDRIMARDYISRHHLVHIPLTAEAQRPQRSHGQRQCVVCNKSTRRPKTKKTTSLMCQECQAPLCMPCFVDYHTLVHY